MAWTDEERDIMRDIYRLVSQHTDPSSKDEYWQNMNAHIERICERHRSHPMAIHFCCAVATYYELVMDGSYDVENKCVKVYGRYRTPCANQKG